MPRGISPAAAPLVLPLTIPAAGDSVTSASDELFAGPLAGGIVNLQNLQGALVPGASTTPIVISISPGRAILGDSPTLRSLDWYTDTGAFGAPPSGPFNGALRVSGEPLVVPIDGLLVGQKLRSIAAWLAGASGHSALPANLPVLSLYKQAQGHVGFATLVISVTDASPSIAAFQAIHYMGIGAFSEAVVAHTSYFLVFTGESGANSIVGDSCYGYEIGVSG